MADVNKNWWTLRVFYGVLALAAGLDKFFHLLTDWTQYLWEPVPDMLNVSATTFMYGVGIIEVIVGIGILTRYTKIFAYVASLWLLSIAVNLVLEGYYDIAVRDIGLSIGAFVLGNLSAMPEAQARHRPARAAA